jgi:hypothetical protein
VAHTCNPSPTEGRHEEGCGLKPVMQIVCKTLSEKYPTQNRTSRVAQVAEHLPSKPEALSSNPSTTKKKKLIVINQKVKIYVISAHSNKTSKI